MKAWPPEHALERFVADAAQGQAWRWSEWRRLRSAFQIARDAEDDNPLQDPAGDVLNKAKCARMDELIQAEAPNAEAMELKFDLLTKRYRDCCAIPDEDLTALMRDALRFARLCDDFLYPERAAAISAEAKAFDTLALRLDAATSALDSGAADFDASSDLICSLEDKLIEMPATSARQVIRKLLIASGLTKRGFVGAHTRTDGPALFAEAQKFLNHETGGAPC
ncbi:hypothetical protein NX02_29205 [Sphingomonas sanxanigenens DSM 19645 = NX02]|uniref:Uncharacterized protein n=2 Tax=Sphingomonas sanxanigenens TaxID=397260 RepID=W0AHM3_9SPHN|nr:hypothetical protein NX02_29205 [Sphingomonas sanxanigenens DSM 19645 = NX02]